LGEEKKRRRIYIIGKDTGGIKKKERKDFFRGRRKKHYNLHTRGRKAL